MAYAYRPHMLAHDRRVLAIPFEGRLESRTSDLIAWTMTLFPVIHQSIRDAKARFHSGQQVIRTYFSYATAEEPTTTVSTTNTARTLSSKLPAIRQRF
jgi:hypothetical protein